MKNNLTSGRLYKNKIFLTFFSQNWFFKKAESTLTFSIYKDEIFIHLKNKGKIEEFYVNCFFRLKNGQILETHFSSIETRNRSFEKIL